MGLELLTQNAIDNIKWAHSYCEGILLIVSHGPRIAHSNAIDNIEWVCSYYQGILSMVSDRPGIE
jgi:hypothetical protein